jgi:hypothetical protein
VGDPWRGWVAEMKAFREASCFAVSDGSSGNLRPVPVSRGQDGSPPPGRGNTLGYEVERLDRLGLFAEDLFEQSLKLDGAVTEQFAKIY